MSQSVANTVTTGQIVADNGESYPDSVYTETTRAVGNQQWVADAWAEGKLPTHSVKGNKVVLRTSTENFRGFQYPDGHGLLKHYGHIQAIRTHSGLVIGDSSCYGRGWAHCNYPKNRDGYMDLTTLKANLKHENETIYDIVGIKEGEVEFDSGRVFDLEEMKWTEQSIEANRSGILGI